MVFCLPLQRYMNGLIYKILAVFGISIMMSLNSGAQSSAALSYVVPSAMVKWAETKAVKTGIASYYAKKFEGRKTYTGDVFRCAYMTAACNVLPMGTWIRVTNLKNNKTVVVKINDKLYYKNKRLLDLSPAAARELGYLGDGLAKVKVEVLQKM